MAFNTNGQTSPITKLPNEVVHMVFAYLNPGEVANLRLLSKRMAVIGLHYLVPTIHLDLEMDSFKKLRDIADHPVASKHVYELVYEVDRLESLSWEDWSRRIIGYGYNSWQYRGLPEPPGANASAADMQAYSQELEIHLSMPVHRLSHEQIHQEWNHFRDAYIEQWTICNSLSLAGVINDALKKLPRLRSVRTSSRNTMTRWMEGFTERLGAEWDNDALVLDLPVDAWKVGLCSTQYILRVLGHHNIPITTLYLAGLNWQFLAQDDNRFMRIKGSFRHLKDLSIFFTGRITCYQEEISEGANRFDSDAFTQIRQRGRLLELFSAAPDLEALTISFGGCDPTIAASFEHTFGTFHWKSLKDVKLMAFETNEDEVLDFFSRHANSLQSISLRLIDLSDGKWSTILHRMHQTMKLKHVHGCWDLSEDYHTRIWNMHKIVKIWDEKRKVFVSSHLGTLVEQYLQQHDKKDMTFEAYLTSLHLGPLEELLEDY